MAKKIARQLQRIDLYFLKLINLKLNCRFLDCFMSFFTHFGSFLFSSCLLLVLVSVPQYRMLGKQLFFALSLSHCLVVFVKLKTKRKRPFVKYEFLNVKKIGTDKISSFPSGHTSTAFSIMTTLFLFLRIPFIFMVLPVLVGISRVYLGVHYPSDIMTGMLIGTLSSIIANIF